MLLSTLLDQKAKQLAHQYLLSEKELISVFSEMDEKRIFIDLGFTGVFAYCQKALRFSESQANYFSIVIRKSRSVPELKRAIEKGDLSVSRARRIVPVVTAENHAEWIEKAQRLPQKQLEVEVAKANPRSVQEKIKPIAENRHLLTLGMSDALREKWERAKGLMTRKTGRSVSLEETLEGILTVFLQKEDPIEKAKRAVLRKVEPSVSSLTIGRVPIPAGIKHAVTLRDQGRCVVSQCTNRIFTQLHHVKPVSQGGQNSIDNLRTLCSSHHRILHRQRARQLP